MPIVKGLASIVLLLVARMASGQQCELLASDGHSLWKVDATGQASIVAADDLGIENPVWSPTYDRIAYTRPFVFTDAGAASAIVVVNPVDATVLQTVPIAPSAAITAVLQLAWASDHTMWIEGLATPQTSIYYSIDLGSGALAGETWGSGFARGAAGAVAYLDFVPYGAPASKSGDILDIDGLSVYPATTDTAQHRFAANIAWSTGGTHLAIADMTVAGGGALIVMRADGSAQSATPLGSAGKPRRLAWFDENILLFADANSSYRLDTQRSSMSKLPFDPQVLSERIATIAGVDYSLRPSGCSLPGPSHLLATAPRSATTGDELTVSATLLDDGGTPQPGQMLSFSFGGAPATATADATGTATASMTVDVPAEAATLVASFAGGIDLPGSAAQVPVSVKRIPTALQLSAPSVFAQGASQNVSATLTDSRTNAPIAGKTVMFTLGRAHVSADTGPDGTATGVLAVPATEPLGSDLLIARFARDGFTAAAKTNQTATVVAP